MPPNICSFISIYTILWYKKFTFVSVNPIKSISRTIWWSYCLTCNLFYIPTIRESPILNSCYTTRNGYRSKRIAISESPLPNCCYTIRNDYGSKSTAIRESIIPNCCYTIGYGNRSKRRATLESIIPNCCYTIGNG